MGGGREGKGELKSERKGGERLGGEIDRTQIKGKTKRGRNERE